MYDPIYSNNIGLVGFRCRVGACKKVVPTYRGIQMHCRRVHGLVAQMTLAYGEAVAPGMEKQNGKEERNTVDGPVRPAECDVLEGFRKLKPDAAGKY